MEICFQIQSKFLWLRSPYAYDTDYAYCVRSSGDFHNFNSVDISYGRKHLRSRVILTAHITCVRPVTSATTTTLSRIPTGVRRTVIIRMKRSMHLEFLPPEISMVEIGYSPLVPTGIYLIDYSKICMKIWLLRSPGTNGANYAWPVYPSGSVSLGTFTLVDDVSYGRKSPGTSSTVVTFCVRSFGDVVINDYHVNYSSYGFIRINLSIITEK